LNGQKGTDPPLRVCVLLPSYEGSSVDYRHYDPPRDLAPLLPGDEVHHEYLKKCSTFRQIRDLRRQRFDIYVNLCEGYLEWDVPSVDVIMALEHFRLPHTGPTIPLYNLTKDRMKQVAAAEGVRYPNFALAANEDEIAAAAAALRFPLFVKPNAAGDSLGVHEDALAHTPSELKRAALAVIAEHDEALIEEYVDGREFTVLVLADAEEQAGPLVLDPIEFVFPPNQRFKTYELKVREYHPEANRPCADPALSDRLKDLARRLFLGFGAADYCRIDLRMDADGELFFLEANFTCGIFYPEGSYGSADYILQANRFPPSLFLKKMIARGLARHRRRRCVYRVRPCAGGGFGIFATVQLEKGEVVFRGEERPQRLVSLAHVLANWAPGSIETFRRYAYPLGRGAYVLWADDPAEWAPQNHSCAPNTAFSGLNVIALRPIAPGEELTLDYSSFCDENMREFACRCGAPACRRLIRGRSRSHAPGERS